MGRSAAIRYLLHEIQEPTKNEDKAMKNYLIVFLTFFHITSVAHADIITNTKNEINPKCVEALKQCLVETNEKKDVCIGETSENAACEGTLLGSIAMKRSALLPVEPAFTGPAMVSKECIANFDNKLSSTLLKGAPTREEISTLNDLLAKCEDSGSNVLDNFKP